ncbi:hypothetical protein [Roseovarius arcticus]|uniref:hypothetical protein n=1 Tax=Roseovarius arcticus TaxID=2547404 RepID=UPI001110DB11|nr:hypothetical protein [Roseovarius arcticus]
MLNYIKFWLRDESGAVTVDWVVLTAAVVGLGLAATLSARTGIDSLAGQIETVVEAIEVANSGG